MEVTSMKSYLMKLSLVSLLLINLLFMPLIHADQLTEEVDKKLKDYDSTVAPGFALGIIKDGKIIHKRGFGMANLEYGIPITSQSVFRIGSVSKQFTAMCILLLEEQGKLSLDDDIRKYVPEIPVYESPITIRHLIHHTSGLRDYLTLQDFRGIGSDEFYTANETLSLLSRQKQLNFKRGEEHLYSNTGYFLLSVIVERAAGQSLAEFAHGHIFGPLGMRQTHYHDDHSRIVKNRATGYSTTKQGYRINETILDLTGDGAVFTSVEDLFLWDQNFYHNQLGKKDVGLIQKMLTPGVLNSGDTLTYAFGLDVEQYKGLNVISHSGGFVGFSAEMIRFPDQKFSVICLGNMGSIDSTSICYQVADIYLGDLYTKDKTEPFVKKKIQKLPLKHLRNKVGTYYDSDSGMLSQVRFKDGRLTLRALGLNVELAPISHNKFITLDAPFEVTIDFLDEKNGKFQKMSIQRQQREPIMLDAIVPVTLDDAQRKAYTGNYYSEELDITYSIVVEDKQLLFKMRRNTRTLRPTIADQFQIRGEGMRIDFFRNEKKQITGFSIKAGRVKNIRFHKTVQPIINSASQWSFFLTQKFF